VVDGKGLRASQALASSPTVESTIANLIQTMASFHAGTSQGALFEPARSGLPHEETAVLVEGHRLASRA
jgi:hypothetical protein